MSLGTINVVPCTYSCYKYFGRLFESKRRTGHSLVWMDRPPSTPARFTPQNSIEIHHDIKTHCCQNSTSLLLPGFAVRDSSLFRGGCRHLDEKVGLAVDSEGDVVLAGHVFEEGGAGLAKECKDPVIMKLASANGDILWRKYVLC